ncbi:MAG: bifunctional phosphopantothenoylcysteine decarboxylase/phosphopantothenate--cysteine ligase CoaBC [Fimbriimonadaceae bacterium]|nr:bifunctional phosphopantothenoylcysteine decarboxylase/phosphopantothenate--cysteine ligase CoaBC [Fimbriimonadaceae bacterium]
MSALENRTIVLGVTGGIAAYKAADLTSKLAQAGAKVRCVLTAQATEFVGPTTFQALSGNPVYTATVAPPETYGMGHLALARADLLIVAPATANLLAKAAHGLADDLLSTTLTAVTCPVLLAPAMNAAMWANTLVQRNVATLRAAGYHFVGPATGWLACREEGAGRMAEPAAILDAAEVLLWPQRDLLGRRVLVTAGPTREALDAVRFLSNPSTGKQGYAIATAARLRGAAVVLVSGPTHLPDPPGVTVERVTTAAAMQAAVLAQWPTCDLFVGAAAVGDYAPLDPAADKPAKVAGELTVRLAATPDIIAGVARARRPGQVVVGFAAETHDLLAHARAKLARKGLDLLVANDVSAPDAGFAGDSNRVTILSANGAAEELPALSKRDVGHELLARAARLLGR